MQLMSVANTSSCTRKITLVDNTPPMLTCPADATFECDDELPGIEATASDLCGDVDITFSQVFTELDCPDIGFWTRTYVATDDCGNTAECTQVIMIEDNTFPNISCPDDLTISCTDSTDPEFTGYATANDNCDPNPFITILVEIPVSDR